MSSGNMSSSLSSSLERSSFRRVAGQTQPARIWWTIVGKGANRRTLYTQESVARHDGIIYSYLPEHLFINQSLGPSHCRRSKDSSTAKPRSNYATVVPDVSLLSFAPLSPRWAWFLESLLVPRVVAVVSRGREPESGNLPEITRDFHGHVGLGRAAAARASGPAVTLVWPRRHWSQHY